MPQFILSLLQTLLRLPQDVAFVSAYESNSDDGAFGWIDVLQLALNVIGTPSRLVTRGMLVSLKDTQRIEHLARVRNMAMSPLYQHYAVGTAAHTDRAARLCRFCQQRVGDKLHKLGECDAYDAVRRSHAELSSDFGVDGVPTQCVCSRIQSLHAATCPVGAFQRDCGQQRWANSPLDVFADGLLADEADAFMSVVGGGLAFEISVRSTVRSEISTLMYTQMHIMTLMRHQPRWLSTGCSG
jgi:hypothetical protein